VSFLNLAANFRIDGRDAISAVVQKLVGDQLIEAIPDFEIFTDFVLRGLETLVGRDFLHLVCRKKEPCWNWRMMNHL